MALGAVRALASRMRLLFFPALMEKDSSAR